MAPESQYWNRFWRRQMSRRRLLQTSALGAAGLAVAGVVGCGDGEEAPAGATATPTATPPPGATATPTPAVEEPKFGGIHRGPLVGFSTGNPPSLDSQRQLTFLAQIPAAYHYSRLVKFAPSRVVDVNGFPSVQIDFSNVEGDAVESVPEVVDGTVLNFKLRDNLNFHDVAPVSGRPVNAEDVKIAIDLFATESPNRGNWLGAVEGITVTGEKTFTITLRRPFAPAFQVLFGNSDGGPWMIPSEVLEDEALSNTNPIGSGPWIFEEWQPDVVIRWRKNPDYYDAPLPYMDGLEAALIGDPETILQNMVAGNFDATLWDSVLWQRALDAMPADAVFQTGPEHVWGGAYFNFAVPPFDKKEVRQALSMSIDRAGILAAFDQPGAAGQLTHVSQFDRFWLDPHGPEFGPNAKYYQRDVAAAKQILEAAGFPDGIDLQATTSTVYGPAYGDRMEAFGLSAADAGFRMQFNYAEYGGYISTTFFGEIGENELGIAPLQGSPMDPHNNIFTIFHPSSARHNWGPRGQEDLPANSPAGDQTLLDLWAAQAAELDFEARVELVRDVQRNMAESMYLIPWTGTSYAYFTQPWVKGTLGAPGLLTRGYAAGSESLVTRWLDRA